MDVIGVGVGRTGTHSLKTAINKLGLGPCHHMEEVLQNMPVQVPLWSAAVNGSPDWRTIYSGYQSAVDWPTACFYRELLKEFPFAKFVLTQRSPENWADSLGPRSTSCSRGETRRHPKCTPGLIWLMVLWPKQDFQQTSIGTVWLMHLRLTAKWSKRPFRPVNYLYLQSKKGGNPSAHSLVNQYRMNRFRTQTTGRNSGTL